MSESVNKLLVEKLQLQRLQLINEGKGGYVCQCNIYDTDKGKIFVKYFCGSYSREMFEGEAASLNAYISLGIIRVPKPIGVVSIGEESLMALEFLQLVNLEKHQSKLGEQLAQVHLKNIDAVKNELPDAIHSFGFDYPTSDGERTLNNYWNSDWVDYLRHQRFQPQINTILSEDDEIEDLWRLLSPNISKFFKNIQVFPSLLHGDLWSGNTAETDNEPVIFDPCSFYGHHEYDISLGMFGGFQPSFYEAYHKIITKASGFQERKMLYELYHLLEHWNHFGGDEYDDTIDGCYKPLTIQRMKELIEIDF